MGLFKKLVHGIHNEIQKNHQEKNNHDSEQQQQQQPINNQNQNQQQDSNAPPPIPDRDYMNSETNLNNNSKNCLVSIPSTANLNSSSTGIFENPISTSPPVSCISNSNIHPVPLPKFYDTPGPIETNNFYGNFLVDDQNLPVWTHPYSIWKSTDDQFKGLGISHTSTNQKVFGEDPNSNPVKYFFNPVGICSMMLSADEFQAQNFDFLVGDLQRFSAGVRFLTNGGSGRLHVPVVQGMGLITGLYDGAITPRLASKVGINKFESKGTTSNKLNKYVATLFDNSQWIIYSTTTFNLQNPNSVVGTKQNGQILVQLAKLSSDKSANYYDEVVGAYAIGCSLDGTSRNDECTYSFVYDIAGNSKSEKVLQWFLPHHVESMDQSMLDALAEDVSLDSTCKGTMSAFIVDRFTMIEHLPPENLKYDPWSDKKGVQGYSNKAKDVIRKVATDEINSFDVVNESNTDSMYTSGKILDKGAFMLYVAAFVLQDHDLANTMLNKMKEAFQRFIENKQKAPLCYETNWKGIVSTSGLQDGNFYCDFGNCFYNDHHFHYGYHIHAAALVALADSQYGDGKWIDKAKPWVETLIRDICNPTTKDTYFPVLRSFDFFNGHSFANGLFAHGDGKDEESTSEDYHAYYGIKLWGLQSNNDQLSTLGSLIVSIEKRAMGMYMLYKNDNKIMPPNFIKNKVSGILFENKIDHATYFGMNKEYIHGIHMIPITPMSNFVRSSEFVKEEWEDMKLGQLADSIDGGWKGLLMLNSAMYDPKKAWDFFSKDNFQTSWLDNGMSRTWSLAYCAGMGGC